jgi:hypothetical protein
MNYEIDLSNIRSTSEEEKRRILSTLNGADAMMIVSLFRKTEREEMSRTQINIHLMSTYELAHVVASIIEEHRELLKVLPEVMKERKNGGAQLEESYKRVVPRESDSRDIGKKLSRILDELGVKGKIFEVNPRKGTIRDVGGTSTDEDCETCPAKDICPSSDAKDKDECDKLRGVDKEKWK